MKWLIAAALLLVVIGVLSGAAYGLRSARDSVTSTKSGADQFLASMYSDTGQIDDAFAIPAWSPQQSDSFSQVNTTVEGMLAHAGEATKTIAKDQRQLETLANRMQDSGGNPMTLPFRDGLARSESRVRTMLSALDAANEGIKVVRDELRLLSSYIDWWNSLDIISTDLQRNDLSAALVELPGLNVKVQTLSQVSQPYAAPQLANLVTTVTASTTDIVSVLRAAQAKDAKALGAAVTKLDADGKALDAIDGTAIDSYYEGKAKGPRDRYVAAAASAGLQVHPRAWPHAT
jgi:hypothetical protein